MNQIKPLDQVLSIEADAHNRIAKIVNKFGSQGSILYRLKEFSSSIPDFRRTGKGNIRHRLDDIIMLIILGRASGCIGRTQIMEFGKYNLDKFRKMGMLRNGVPSEATLCRVDNGIDELAMADMMQRFVEVFHDELLKNDCGKEIICVEAKPSAVMGVVVALTKSTAAHPPRTPLPTSNQGQHHCQHRVTPNGDPHLKTAFTLDEHRSISASPRQPTRPTEQLRHCRKRNNLSNPHGSERL